MAWIHEGSQPTSPLQAGNLLCVRGNCPTLARSTGVKLSADPAATMSLTDFSVQRPCTRCARAESAECKQKDCKVPSRHGCEFNRTGTESGNEFPASKKGRDGKFGYGAIKLTRTSPFGHQIAGGRCIAELESDGARPVLCQTLVLRVGG